MKSIIVLSVLASFGVAVGQEKKAASFEVAGLTFEVPSSWKAEKAASPMRKAQYSVGGAEVVVYFFGKGQGGTVEANATRWYGQFKEPKEKLGAKSTAEKVGVGKVTTVEAKGTFMSGPPFGEKVAKVGYALRGAIVEFPEGPVFIKMTGPEKDVTAAVEGFDKVVRSGLKD